jgi:hypothetical protein
MEKSLYKTDEFHNLFRVDDNGFTWSIPKDPANSDYQAYLKSLDEA